MTTIRIAIVDDHSVIRQGMRSLLTEAGMDVVGEASDGNEALKLITETQPDVMLLDIRMKGRDGLDVLPELKTASPLTQIIMLTTYANPSYLAQAMQHGASGYLLKESDLDEIISAVRTAAKHTNLINPQLLKEALKREKEAQRLPAVAAPKPLQLSEPISDRELDVLRLITKGMSNAEIADALSISVTTVKTHVKHILQKLHVSDRTQAALVAVRHGLVK